jgi:hypothetical protein
MRKLSKIFSVLLVFVLGMFLAITINVMAAGTTTATAKYEGSSSVNMSDGNNAEIIGLEPTIFTVISIKRNINPLHVGLNAAGQIRLYGSSDTNGNILDISINEEYEITKVKYNFGDTVNRALIKIDEDEKHNGTLTKNSSLEFDNLKASSFSIKNIATGTGQIYILSIEITYQSTQEPLIESLKGASIRTEGTQGLRFSAKVNDSTNIQEKGFYLLKGEATVADLELALSNPVGETGKHQHQGKDVIKVEVPGVTVDNEFSVVLIGIPPIGYLDDITVIPYAKMNSNDDFYDVPSVRSVGQVAINMAQAGAPLPQGVQDVLNTINNNFTRVGIIGENLEIAKGLKDADNNYVNSSLYTIYNPDVTEIILPEPAPKPSQNFLGWYANPELTGEAITSVQTANITAITTLYPKWELVLPSIDEVRDLAVDEDVEFVGVVTGFTDYSTEYSNYDKVFVEDSTGAIVVYRAAFPEDLKIGDKFLIVGKLGQFNGLIQIAQGATVTLIDSDNDLILPVEVTNVAEINEDFQAKRIDLEGTVVSVTSNGQTMVVKVGENEITVRSNSDSNAHIVNAHLLTAVIGQEVNLNGIHVDWFNGAQLLPTTVEQIVFVELSDEMKVADAKANLIVPSIVATEEISLPTEGLHGTVITWASSNETIIATDGTVVLPTEETEVTLTATITLGEVTDTKEFLVTVFPLGSEPQILNQSDFGETDGWGNYGERTDQAIEHGEEDPNPSGNSSWDLNGGNVNNTGWDYIRMGGKAASTKEGLQVYLKTNFTFEVEIKEIIIDIVGLDSASGNETIWLQTSTDGESWTDVTSKEITAVGDLVFDNLTIASGNYFRFVIVRGSTSSNKGTDIKTITFKG